MTIKTVNPATGSLLAEYSGMNESALDATLQAVTAAQRLWQAKPVAERAAALGKVATQLRARAGDYAQLMANEMGKPLKQGEAEIEKCAKACDYYVEHAASLLAPRRVEIDSGTGKVVFRPLGVILAIMPWNFPFWQVLRFAAPTLVAGNGAVLKHAANVTGSALAIEQLFVDAGLPDNLFRTLLIDHGQAEWVIRDRRVHGVSLTGSVGAGRAVAAVAGHELKKVVLELGGSDAYVVLEDADIALAAKHCVAGRFINAGQSCVAAKRFIVVDAVRQVFQDAVMEATLKLKFGRPETAGIDLGPMARADLRDELHKQVRDSIARGARCLIGGEIPTGEGAFYPPTLLVDVRPGMPAYDDELFGPVASIINARDEADALRIANDSPFGLGGAVFTRNTARGERIAIEGIESGMVGVNQQLVSDPRLPFGGIKHSGVGREVGEFGIFEFVNIKTITVAA